MIHRSLVSPLFGFINLFSFPISFFFGIFWFCIKIGVNKKTLYGCPQCTQRNRRQNSITCEIDSSRKVTRSCYGNSLVPEFRDLGSMWFFAVNVSFTSTFTFWSLSIVEWHFFAYFKVFSFWFWCSTLTGRLFNPPLGQFFDFVPFKVNFTSVSSWIFLVCSNLSENIKRLQKISYFRWRTSKSSIQKRLNRSFNL